MKIVAVPDIHFPYANWDHVNRTLDWIDRKTPDLVVQLGDIADCYCFSHYSRNLSFITPEEELTRAREDIETFWAAVKCAAPKAKLVGLLGNHEARLRKQMAAKWPEGVALLDLLDVEQLWRVDGVDLISDPTRPYIVDEMNLLIVHGDFLRTAKPGERVKYVLRNVIAGHTHSASVYYLPRHDGVLWELICGSLADPSLLPLQYGAIKTPQTVNGIGYVDDDGCRFVPFGG